MNRLARYVIEKPNDGSKKGRKCKENKKEFFALFALLAFFVSLPAILIRI
jgi:hypothetical protein